MACRLLPVKLFLIRQRGGRRADRKRQQQLPVNTHRRPGGGQQQLHEGRCCDNSNYMRVGVVTTATI